MERTTKEIFRVMYQYARNEVNHRGKDNATSAFWAVERAERAWFENFGYDEVDIDRILTIGSAVLWAIHWKYFAKPMQKLWHSERRIAFVLNTVESGLPSRQWMEPARLP
jgi:hypothetical protein